MRLILLPLLVCPLAQAQSARIEIGPPGGGLTASTYASGSFVVVNTSGSDRITELRLDLSTSLFEDLIFDPNGTGGDLVSKGFTADSGDTTVGLASHAFLQPAGGGFDELRVQFTDFDPGETFTFSIDVDPNTILGVAAPGPHESGSVSGLELSGATVEVFYEGGATQTSETFRVATSLSESAVDLNSSLAPAPTLSVLGAITPSKVFAPSWTVRITGTPGRAVSLLVVEGGLYTAGVPGGGFDIDPFEANTAIAVSEHQAILDGSGQADIAITLQQSATEGGFHSLMAVEEDAGGIRGRTSGVHVLQYVDAPISFQKTNLAGASLSLPTTLQFGPDDRLYVGQQGGNISAFTVTRVGSSYSVMATEVIDLVKNIPNHDDDGSLNAAITTRQVTGILVAGTPENPKIFVGSSDPRIGAGGSGTDLDLDTNSGVVSLLTRDGGGVWTRQDLVRGLPRSEENHGPNGMQLDPVTNTLYLAHGGHTNMGAPSNNFALTPEYALSAAILSIDLDAIGSGTYDLPTLDDEDRPGTDDANDPFGGNNAKNQAKLVPGGPVQVHSPGWRNAYDLVITESGEMYAVDNGPNGGWGDTPIGTGGLCTNAVSEPGVTHEDGLHHIPSAGYYAGHPNPTRANPANTFNPTNPQSPVSVSNPVECEYREPGVDDGALATWNSSTNGITEYTSSAFGGAMAGDLLLVSLNQQVRRVKLSASGSNAILVENLFSSVGSGSLDLVAQADSDPFPGTIWVANRTGNDISVFYPDSGGPCLGTDDVGLDEDFDGYSNADEIDNGTDPCSPADVPPDNDGDFVSDLNDTDDDNDAIPDHTDFFALDASNGLDFSPPFTFEWETTSGDEGGILGLGFTGLMSNGVSDYLDLFDPGDLTAGGAAGVLTIETAGSGAPEGAANDLEAGFQVGFRPSPTSNFTVRTRVVSPFLGLTPAADQRIGMFLGTGGQDDFIALRLTGAGVEFQSEFGGATGTPVLAALTLPGPGFVDLWLEVDPVALTATPYFDPNGGGPVQLPVQTIPSSWVGFGQTLAAGLYLSAGASAPFAATWDFLEIDGDAAPTRINAGGPLIADWQPDDAFASSGAKFSVSSTVTPDGTVPTLVPAEIFQSERYKSGDIDWTFPLTLGKTYDVRLYFAEIFFHSIGDRVFDVEIEGTQVLDDYDIFADVGADVGTMKEFQVTLQDSDLVISLNEVTNTVKISGMEIIEVPAGVPGLIEQYGLGLGGANLGSLDSQTPPAIGEILTLDLATMGPSPQAVLMFSNGQATLPLLGGTLLITLPPIADPVFVVLVGGAGSLSIPIPDSPSSVGLVFASQAAALDAGQVGGWRFSNGLKLTLGSE